MVVSESKRTVSSGRLQQPQKPHDYQKTVSTESKGQELEDLLHMNEQSESRDITEEEIEYEPRAHTQHLSSKAKGGAFNYGQTQNVYKRSSQQVPQNLGTSSNAPSNRESETGQRSLLEESQEYVVFHSDSKIQSPNMSSHHNEVPTSQHKQQVR